MELKEESQTHRLKAVWTIPKFSELEHEFDVCSQSLPVRVGPHPFRIDLLAGGTPPGEDKQAGVAVRVKNESKRRIDVKLSVTLRGKKVVRFGQWLLLMGVTDQGNVREAVVACRMGLDGVRYCAASRCAQGHRQRHFAHRLGHQSHTGWWASSVSGRSFGSFRRQVQSMR